MTRQPKKRLDQVCACRATVGSAEGFNSTPVLSPESASTMPAALRKPTSIGPPASSL